MTKRVTIAGIEEWIFSLILTIISPCTTSRTTEMVNGNENSSIA